MEYDFNKTVGQKLYEARKAKGYSRAKVGALVNLHETTVKRYEDGDIKTLDIERLKAFAKVLGTPAAELLGWLSDSNSDEDLTLMMQMSEEATSGREQARAAMFRLFGAEHETNSLQLVGDKTALLYYKAVDRRNALELKRIIDTVDDLDYAALENIRILIQAYLSVDKNFKAIVDTTLAARAEEIRAAEDLI